MISDNVRKLKPGKKPEARVLVITTAAFYKTSTSYSVKRRVELSTIPRITESKTSNQFVVHVPSEWDFWVESKRKGDIIAAMVDREKSIKVVQVDDSDLAKYVKTRRESRYVMVRALRAAGVPRSLACGNERPGLCFLGGLKNKPKVHVDYRLDAFIVRMHRLRTVRATNCPVLNPCPYPDTPQSQPWLSWHIIAVKDPSVQRSRPQRVHGSPEIYFRHVTVTTVQFCPREKNRHDQWTYSGMCCMVPPPDSAFIHIWVHFFQIFQVRTPPPFRFPCA